MKKKCRNKKELGRTKRHYRIRKNVSGTKDKPRLSIHRSSKNLQALFVDDVSGAVLLSVSTMDKGFKKDNPWGGNIVTAKKLGSYAAETAKKKGIKQIVFDRGGYLYHGRIKAFTEGAREAGLVF